jgi:hypothetical protein
MTPKQREAIYKAAAEAEAKAAAAVLAARQFAEGSYDAMPLSMADDAYLAASHLIDALEEAQA